MKHAGSLTRRLISAQAMVGFVSFTATMAVALAVAPAVFDEHMRQAGHANQPAVMQHAQEAFQSAGLAALAAGALAATITAALASALVSRRIGQALDALSAAAHRVAAHRYDQRVTLSGSGHELDAVASAFNSMAERIQHTETVRHQLMADLAHELRTPLAVIDVTLEATEDHIIEQTEMLATLREQTSRLQRLSADLRQLSAATEGHLTLHPQTVHVNDILNAAARSARPAATRAHVTITTEPAAQHTTITLDPQRIGQVLDNLTRNAIAHTPTGGAITLHAETTPSAVLIHVHDNGSGLTSEDLTRVFDRFYRVPRPDHTPGTGLGLAIARALTTAHHGTLTAHSDGPGAGSTFTLTLPRTPPSPRTPRPSPNLNTT